MCICISLYKTYSVCIMLSICLISGLFVIGQPINVLFCGEDLSSYIHKYKQKELKSCMSCFWRFILSLGQEKIYIYPMTGDCLFICSFVSEAENTVAWSLGTVHIAEWLHTISRLPSDRSADMCCLIRSILKYLLFFKYKVLNLICGISSG